MNKVLFRDNVEVSKEVIDRITHSKKLQTKTPAEYVDESSTSVEHVEQASSTPYEQDAAASTLAKLMHEATATYKKTAEEAKQLNDDLERINRGRR